MGLGWILILIAITILIVMAVVGNFLPDGRDAQKHPRDRTKARRGTSDSLTGSRRGTSDSFNGSRQATSDSLDGSRRITGSRRSRDVGDVTQVARIKLQDIARAQRTEAPDTAALGPPRDKTESTLSIPDSTLAQFARAKRVPARTPFDYPRELDRVDCSVFAPPRILPKRTIMVQVFAHAAGDAQEAAGLAREFDAAAHRRAIQILEADLAPGDRLTFQLAAPGLQVDDPVQHLVWRRAARAVQFAVTAPADAQPRTVIAKVTVSRRTVPVGHLKFKLEIVPTAFDLRPDQPLGDSAARYRKAFVSYASRDRAEVIKRVQMLRTMRIDFVQDVLNLSPGARWKQGLFRWIDECDLFLLFWSHAAKQSEWVQKEIDYALQRKGGDDFAPPEIQPVVIEGPPFPSPPNALKDLHFGDPLLYFAQSSRPAR